MKRLNSNILDVTVQTDTKKFVWCQYKNKFVLLRRGKVVDRSSFCSYKPVNDNVVLIKEVVPVVLEHIKRKES